MNVLKTGEFLTDAQLQHEWYALNAGPDIAERYLNALEIVTNTISSHPMIGPAARFKHPQLRQYRFFLLQRPFQPHLVFMK